MGRHALRVAAVQMEASLGDVAANVAQAERLAREALRLGASWVILPELFTSAMAFHPCLLDAARPIDGEPAELLAGLAHEHAGVVGGSFMALRGEHAYDTFVLAFPNGATYRHDKDQPTMWENCYYVGGEDDGVLRTPAGPVGVALCWEMLRTRTVRRLRGRVDLVLGGSCWWGLPEDAPADHPLRAQSLALLRAAPVTLARLLGVPVVHASHAGLCEGFRPPDETALVRRCYLGEAQIVDGHGRVLARMPAEDGEGVIVGDIVPGEVAGARPPVSEGFWIPELPPAFLEAWERLNRHGEQYYREVTLPHRRRDGGR